MIYQVDMTNLLFPLMKNILDCGCMNIRNLEENEEPYLYASGWSGPGYLLIKALVSYGFFKSLNLLLAFKVASKAPKISFVAGNVTGGVIPGWLLSNYLEILLGHEVKFMYVSGTREFEEASKKPIMIVNKIAIEDLAHKIADGLVHAGIDFVAGGSPGGMPLAYRVSEILSQRLSKHVPFVYVRDKKKSGGQKELLTGTQNNPFFKSGMTALAIGDKPYEDADIGDMDKGTQHVINALEEAGFKPISFHDTSEDSQISDYQPETLMKIERPLVIWDKEFPMNESEGLVAEELTNFTHSTIVSAQVLEKKYKLYVPNAACILSYDQPQSRKVMEEEGMDMIHLFTLREFLYAAQQFGTHYGKLIKAFRSYLADPLKWNADRGIKRKDRGGTI